MAKALPNLPVTVLTNSIKVAIELSQKKQITVISTGGTLLSKSLSFVGPLAESSLDTYHVNKAFISCKGLHLESGISESNERQARIKQKMIESVDLIYLMMDHTKFGVQAFARINSLDSLDHLITDSKVDTKMVQQLTDRSLHLIRV